ncbi:MAG: NUDIX hydrolase [Kiritimatiellales bacterium]|nr:NUDIX hydrolase [Kiritimatiellales bacterium]
MDPFANQKYPLLTVDCIIFTAGGLVLVRRGNPPFKGELALPGGIVELGETVEEACKREVKEETGLDVINMQLVGVYSDSKRDPRGHTITIAFLGTVESGDLLAGDDAAEAVMISDWEKVDLAFDHKRIISDAINLKSTNCLQ